jgi:mannan endo-1,4-beta-mannosidase
MQAPRSFWDASFVENSWITSSNGNTAITLLPVLKNKINTWWPGTKLGFTEWSFSGTNHVSGGIATADMFGIFGKYGIYESCFWGDISNYISSAFKLYRNYDGNKGTFENTSVQAAPGNTSDYVNTSVYASVNSASDAKLHLIVFNKHWTNSINATFSITSPVSYKNAKLYMFNDASATITLVGTVTGITGNTFTYSLPKLSAFHIVLDDGSLPLELLDFSGKTMDDKSILLNWKATAERELKGYKLERKTISNEDHWEEIYSAKALNNYNSIADYYYEDKNADQNTTLFYRLSSLDKDGIISLSKMLTVQSLHNIWTLSIFPNPSEQGFTIQSNVSDREIQVQIKDIMGRIIETDTITGKNYFSIGAELKPGIYYAEFSDGEEKRVIKIVKN